MSSEGSVTCWLDQLKAGDRGAVPALWKAYYHRLVALARGRLRNVPRRAADEEDVALCAFDSFCHRAEHGQFSRLDDRDDLWQLLFVLTVRKAVDLARHEGRRSRGGRARILSLSAEADLGQILSSGPTPEMEAQVADECRHLLDRLGDGTLRAVAVWKMEGYTNAEVAERLGCVVQTVERKLRRIRNLWARELR